jgi:hypothetical protein
MRSVKRLILAYKNFAANRNISHIGLGVAALNTAKVLRASGIAAEVWPITSAAELSSRLDASVSHVVTSAPWIPTEHWQRLTAEHPEITFSVNCHSNVGFLQADANGVRRLRDAMELERGTWNFHVAGNSRKFCDWIRAAYRAPCSYLANLYYLEPERRRYLRTPFNSGALRIGAFGATRPLKNLMSAAGAALEIAGQRFRKVRPIQRIPLLGHEARVADDAAQFLFAGAMVRAGGRHHVLFDHDAAHVVAAEAQTQLAGLQPLRHPRRLHVLEIIQVNARDRQRLQVLHGRRFFLHEVAERSILALERPRDEGRESAGLFLQIAHQLQVIHALLDGLAAAEHHGGGGAHAELVRGAVHIHPILRVALQPADAMAHGIVQNLGAAAGDGIEARNPSGA